MDMLELNQMDSRECMLEKGSVSGITRERCCWNLQMPWDWLYVNTWFTKTDSQKVTYESGGGRTQVDYVLIRKEDRPLVSKGTVIQSEACIPQHKLVMCEMKLVERLEKKREVFVSKCRVRKLKEEDLQS